MALLIKQDDVLAYIMLHENEPELLRPIRLAADKAIKKNSSVQLKKGNQFKYSMWAYDQACALWEQVKQNYPFSKEPKLEQWAHDIWAIHRIDGYDYKVIDGVMRFSQYDEFWRQQVRSGANLRKHFEKVLVKAKEYQQKQQTRKGGTYSV